MIRVFPALHQSAFGLVKGVNPLSRRWPCGGVFVSVDETPKEHLLKFGMKDRESGCGRRRRKLFVRLVGKDSLRGAMQVRLAGHGISWFFDRAERALSGCSRHFGRQVSSTVRTTPKWLWVVMVIEPRSRARASMSLSSDRLVTSLPSTCVMVCA